MKNKAPKSGNTSGCIILFIAVFIIFPIFYFAVKSTPPIPPQPSEKTQEKTGKIIFPATPKISEQKQAKHKESTISQAESLKIELQNYLSDLLKFKREPDFLIYGFGRNGKYYKWLENIENLANRVSQNKDLPFDLRCVPSQLQQLGMEYVKSRGQETPYTRETLPEIKNLINY